MAEVRGKICQRSQKPRSSPQLVLMFENENLLWRVGMVTPKRLKRPSRTGMYLTKLEFEWNPTWFPARIFSSLESTECRDLRHKYPHILASTWSKLARRRLAEVGHFWHKARGVVVTVGRSCLVWPSAAKQKSLKTPKNNARNHRYSVILYCSTCVGKFEGHLVYLEEISEQRSLIREIDSDQPAWRIYVSVYKGWAACDFILVFRYIVLFYFINY